MFAGIDPKFAHCFSIGDMAAKMLGDGCFTFCCGKEPLARRMGVSHVSWCKGF